MPNLNKKYNSVNSKTAQEMRNYQNVMEIITKLDQSLHSNDSFVTLKTVDAQGNEVLSQFPTIGYFKQELDTVIKNLRILSGTEGNPASIQIGENAFKRIISADLNLEPKKINSLDAVSTFKTNPNWIFDAFLNPKISVEIDLTGKVDQSIRSVQARRFIVEFDKSVSLDADGNEVVTLTSTAQTRKAEFDAKYKGKSNIDIIEFVQWLKQPGLVNRVDNTLIDEDYFKLEANRLQHKGNFTVLGTDVDSVNKKLWYLLDTLTYYDVSNPDNPPAPVQLKVGDLVNVNPNVANVTSTTVYKVIEISTVTSDLRVRFEQVYGEEPIPVRLNALAFYSEFVPSRKVRVSIGFDEYNVLFVRPFDEDNNLIGQEWSPGIGFYTNELKLENNNGQEFSEYYIQQVYDYGIVLEDLVQKKVPNYYGLKPNAPLVNNDNFKVVQINQHLTNTVDAEKVRDLHNSKNDLASQVSQLQSAVENKNRLIETTTFDSQADRKKAEDELSTLQAKLKTKNETKFTIVKDILASKKNINKIEPKFRVRGFWPMPDPTTSTKTAPQEVVQFEVWYRYLNKSGAENPITTFPDIINSAVRNSSELNTTVNPNLTKPKTVNGAFSNWQKYRTDARKRTQDTITGEWKWEIVDVQDANTPNINQIDLAISPGERVEIKIKSLSEVGWPETPMESEFSDLLSIDFPDDLNNILSDDQFILKEASADDLKVAFQRDLDAQGLSQHLSSFVRVDNIYYAHKADAITSGFKDGNGSILNLYDKLVEMVARITSLEEQLARGKGELSIFISNKGTKQKVFSGNNLTFNVNLEDYMIKTKIGMQNAPVDNGDRCYRNDVYIVEDFVLELNNSAASSPLGLLANRNYAQLPGGLPSLFAWSQQVAQGIWVGSNNEILYKDQTGIATADTIGPKLSTQINNQWIWLQNKDVNGVAIYGDARHTTGTVGLFSALASITQWEFPRNYATTPSGIQTEMARTVISSSANLGFESNNLYGGTVPNTSQAVSASAFDVTDDKNWSWMVNYLPNNGRYIPNTVSDLGTAIIPVISNFNDITDNSSQQLKILNIGDANTIKIPLKIMFRPYTGCIVLSPSTSATEFKDTLQVGSAGDMPVFSSYAAASGGKLRINLSATPTSNYLQEGDKIVLTGITDTAIIGANNKPLKILAKSAAILTLDYPATGTPTAGSEVLVQVHLSTTQSAATSTQFRQYTVYGNLAGQDTPFIKNYIEFYTPSTTPTPTVHTKKLRFYVEAETNARPIEFQFNWIMTQFKRVAVVSTINNGNGGNGGSQGNN